MKNINVEVPRGGTSLRLVLRSGASSGQAVIVTSDDVEVRFAEPRTENVPGTKKAQKRNADGKTPKGTNAVDLDSVLKRLLKLKPAKRSAAVNSIKTMFQFDAPITDEAANKILNDLQRRGSLNIDGAEKIQFRDA